MIRQNNSNRMNHRPRTNTSRSGGDTDSRGRNPSSRNSHEPNQNSGRARGNPRQLREKYMALAQEAISSGNIIDAETYYQHADHYYRLIQEESGQNSSMKKEPCLPKEQFPVRGNAEEQKRSDVDPDSEEVE